MRSTVQRLHALGAPAGVAATFVTVADEAYFVGLVALINAMALVGARARLVVLDAGMTAPQRARIAPHCSVIDVDPAQVGNPMLLKSAAEEAHPEGTVVILDADLILTDDPAPVLSETRQGRILAFPDFDHDRWFAQWRELLGLRAAPRRQTYVSTGFLAFSTGSWPRLLERWRQTCERIPRERTRAGGAPKSDPLWDSDQDALNAILMSEVPSDAVQPLEKRLAPATPDELARVRVKSRAKLRCRSGGRSPLMLHYGLDPKAWHRTAWRNVRRNAYTRLLPRVLLAPDVPVPLWTGDLPPWLRGGLRHRALLAGLDGLNRTKAFTRGWLLPRLRRRVALLGRP